jgi:serine/threonine-protein kinase
MSLAPGTRLGPYEIGAQIGVGGMGEVYRARDIKLQRDVAIKVLPEALAHNTERLARFEREARTLASLNHPNIAQIHGLQESDGTRALVMELVEGPTLADRIAHGAIPVDESLPIARQIAEALEAAHEQGIIHRDLKPANVKVRPDGIVKVLDFGLAKALDPAASATIDTTASPTITSPALMTRMGVILGTAAYMSPEQARGRPADKRSDVWAFGYVLYEMLTGRRAFESQDVSEALAAVLRDEPNWTALPPDLSLSMRTLIKRCLDKDPARRIADISIARYVLDEPAIGVSSASESTRALPSGGSRTSAKRRIATHTAAALLASAVVGAAVWLVARSSVLPPRVSRFLISLQGATALTVNSVDRNLVITSDGSRIIYVGDNATQLFVRPLDALEPAAIYKGDFLRGPFVSPDGQWVGFIQSNSTLQKVAISGGPAITLARLNGVPRGATWAPNDTILFATTDPTSGLLRIPAGGGAPEVLTRPDRAKGEVDHLWPEMLPHGRAVLFTISAPIGGLDAAQVAVLDLESRTHKVLVRGGSHAHYVSSGHLVYAAAESLMAVGFDPTRLETRGSPVPVIARPLTTVAGALHAVVAGNGTLAYVSGVSGGAVESALVWVDRQRRETPITVLPGLYINPRIAPDGTRVAFYKADPEFDIWLWDFAGTTVSRFTSDPGNDVNPVWTPESNRLIFASERGGTRNLFSQAGDGTGTAERLTKSPNAQNPTAVTLDGTRLIFTETAPTTGDDVMQLQLDGTHSVTPLVQTPFTERNGTVSPDGRWLAYEANDSGPLEIYVRPFPVEKAGLWRVSTGGGTSPRWAPGGQELFYVNPSGALMRVGVERSQTWVATVPAMLSKEGFRSFDISPDGQRFLISKPSGGPDQDTSPTSIVVVLNWFEELKRLVPTK